MGIDKSTARLLVRSSPHRCIIYKLVTYVCRYIAKHHAAYLKQYSIHNNLRHTHLWIETCIKVHKCTATISGQLATMCICNLMQKHLQYKKGMAYGQVK